ncbi:MAG: acyltransferase [Xanthomonadales bacterium]|nr:acyltransferase [Xanthomonadales bacterium]
MLINIQFLRMIAAMLVVLYHTSSHVRASGIEQGSLFEVMEAVGFAGVDIFFVISGFIMAHTSVDARGAGDGWAFLRRRMARIYSGYWPFFLLALALFAWIDPSLMEKAKLLQSAILWPAYPLLIAVSWTLIFEMFFYLLFAVIICITDRRRSLFLVVLFGLMLLVAICNQFVRHAYDPGHLETLSLAENLMLSPYLLEFLGGALLAGWLHRESNRQTTMNDRRWDIFLLAAGCVFFLLGGWINNRYFDGGIEQGYAVFYRVLAFGVPSLLILAALVRLDQKGRRAPLQFSLLTGGASYAIYLSHGLILASMQKLGFNDYAGGLGAGVAQILYLVLAALILGYSVMHFRWIERPLHRILKGWLRVS